MIIAVLVVEQQGLVPEGQHDLAAIAVVAVVVAVVPAVLLTQGLEGWGGGVLIPCT